ncbi:hypothetical protein CLAIMM_00491 [Cladophialophora immunda]|nr:hypothetical protein CLAIMM_00491 [Cladophialophora immunda]
MTSVLVTLLISLAGFVLISAEQRPVVHNRLVRRCDNETQPWFYGNDTDAPSPWGVEHSGTGQSQPTGYPSHGPCGAWGYTSPVETATWFEGDSTVITVTMEATPAPITPSPITPPPEEITLTATVTGRHNHTSSATSGQATTGLSGTGSESSSTWPTESAAITMTIVIGNNTTSIVSTSQPLVSTTSSSNSSIISAISNSASTDNSESQAMPPTDSVSPTSSLVTSSAGNATWTPTSSVLPVPSSALNATASSTDMSPSNSTATGLSNTTTTSAISGNSGLPPASITSSPYWTNATSSAPCSLTPSYLWRDWNWTTPSASTYRDNSNTANSTPTSTGSPGSTSQPTALAPSNATSEASPASSTEASPTGDNSTVASPGSPPDIPTAIPPSPDQQTNGTATPTTGDWFAMSTLGDGNVLTTFVTHFGPALSASDSSFDAAAVSPSSRVGHRVVIPPKRKAAWADMEDA